MNDKRKAATVSRAANQKSHPNSTAIGFFCRCRDGVICPVCLYWDMRIRLDEIRKMITRGGLRHE